MPGADMNETITVVIGDTNAEYAQAIRRGLEAHGYTVLKVAEDGITLIDAIKRMRPGLVIMDVILSRLDGFAVMEELHQLPSLEWPKILVHTALNQENIMLRIYSMGADYLSKPAPISQVVRRVDAVCWQLPAGGGERYLSIYAERRAAAKGFRMSQTAGHLSQAEGIPVFGGGDFAGDAGHFHPGPLHQRSVSLSRQNLSFHPRAGGTVYAIQHRDRV